MIEPMIPPCRILNIYVVVNDLDFFFGRLLSCTGPLRMRNALKVLLISRLQNISLEYLGFRVAFKRVIGIEGGFIQPHANRSASITKPFLDVSPAKAYIITARHERVTRYSAIQN
jgi:hypothetical protein